MNTTDAEFEAALRTVTSHLLSRNAALPTLPILPSPSALRHTTASLPRALPPTGLGTEATTQHLLENVLSGCLQAQNGPAYFGFVIGGVTPAAQLADILLSGYDENAGMNNEAHTSSAKIEASALGMVLDLIGVDRGSYKGRTITTGATASNVLGMGASWVNPGRSLFL